MRKAASFDLILLAVVFWAGWRGLKMIEIDHAGAVALAVSAIIGLALVVMRGVSLSEIGLMRPRRIDLSLAMQAAFVIGLVFLSAPLITHVFGPFTASSAIAQQPQHLKGLALDILIFTWLSAGVVEELFFRGILLNRFRALFGAGAIGSLLAVAAQGIWFGFGHAEQGVAGIVLTGLLGTALGLFFLWRAKGSLIPLMIAHAMIDTFVLSLNYFSKTFG